MLSQKNKTHVIVGKDLALATSSQTIDDLVAGKIGVFKSGSSVATTSALSAGDKFRVVYKNVDGNVLASPVYDYSLLLKKKAAGYVASTEQKTAIGFNGTTGSIAVSNSDVYHIHVTRKDSSAALAEHGLFKLAAAYQSDATATQTEIMQALLANAIKNFSLEKAKSGVEVTKVGLINSNTVTLTNDFAGNAVVVKGSKAITVTSSGQYATNTDIVAGDYIRLGATIGTAVTVAANVYRIVSFTGTTTKVVVLDRPVTEPSGTYATGTGTEVIPKATAEAANWGITFESIPVRFVPGLFKYQNVTFDVTLSEAFGSTPITDISYPTKGTGTYKEVAEIEWELSGNRGEGYKVASYPVSQNLNATSGKTYDVISLDFANDEAKGLDGNVRSWHSLIIFTEDESVSTVHTDLKTIFSIT